MNHQDYPRQNQIDTFNKLLDEGWSVTYAMSKAKITGVQYTNFLKKDDEARARIAEYKKAKTEGRRYSYAGIPLTLNQLKEAGLENDYYNMKLRLEYEERTKLEMEKLLDFKLKQSCSELPRGI